jgi:hypothetical protein
MNTESPNGKDVAMLRRDEGAVTPPCGSADAVK